MRQTPVVFVVDDDPAAREAVVEILIAHGVTVEPYPSAEEFLARFDRARRGCLVVDVRMTGMSGLELLQRLQAEDVYLPAVVITGYGDVPTAVEAMRGGAVTFLEKPCDGGELWDAVSAGLNRHRSEGIKFARRNELARRFSTLTVAEQAVMAALVQGKTNKAIAAELEIGLRTVELRRAGVMQKMGATSLAELVQLDQQRHEKIDGVDP